MRQTIYKPQEWNTLQSAPKESLHLWQSQVLKRLEEKYWNSKGWWHRNKKLLCSHSFEFENEAWLNLDQLNGGCGTPPTFASSPLTFQYSTRLKRIILWCWLQITECRNMFSIPRRHFLDPGQLRLWSPDLPLWFSIESPDSRVRGGQGPRNVSWVHKMWTTWSIPRKPWKD